MLHFRTSIADVICVYFFFFFKQKTAYEMRISDWSSDVCSSDLPDDKLGTTDDKEIDAATRSILAQFEGYAKLNKKIPAELLPSLASMDAPGRLADTIAAHLNLKLEDKQEVLEIDDAQARIEHVMRQLENEIDVLQIEKKIPTP